MASTHALWAAWPIWRSSQRLHSVPTKLHYSRRLLRTTACAKKGLKELLSLAEERRWAKKSLLGDRPKVEAGKVSPVREVPGHIARPPYAASGRQPDWDPHPQIQRSTRDVAAARAAGQLAGRVLRLVSQLVRPGVKTDAIDQAVHEATIAAGAYPSPLGYGSFPKSVCTSINEVVCHGIPDSRELREGDIVNVDVTVFLNGFHGDTSAMFFVGEPSPEARRLVETTQQALAAGIAVCRPGAEFREIGAAIQEIADAAGYGLVADFCGHGVGRVFHSYPTVLHHRNGDRGRMVPGMTFTIEPMLTQGTPKVQIWRDGWTAVTRDGGLSAQCEHSLLITDDGVEILTLVLDPEGGADA